MITPKEAERAAYIAGDTERASLWAAIVDTEAVLLQTQDDLFNAEERITGLEILLEAKE